MISRNLERYNSFIIQHIDNKTKFEEKILSTSFLFLHSLVKMLKFTSIVGYASCGPTSIESFFTIFGQCINVLIELYIYIYGSSVYSLNCKLCPRFLRFFRLTCDLLATERAWNCIYVSGITDFTETRRQHFNNHLLLLMCIISPYFILLLPP